MYDTTLANDNNENQKLSDSKEKLAKTAKPDAKTKTAAAPSTTKHHTSSTTASQKRASNPQASSKNVQKSNESISSHSSSTQNINQSSSKKPSHDASSNAAANTAASNTGTHAGHQRNADVNATKESHASTEKDTSVPTTNEEKKTSKVVASKATADTNNTTSQNTDDHANTGGNSANVDEATAPAAKATSNDPTNGGNNNNNNGGGGRPRSHSQQNQQKVHASKSNDANTGGINENIPEANADDQIDIAIEQEAVVSHIIANSRYRERPASARPPPPKQRHTNIIQDSPVKVATPIVIQETSQQQDEEEENEYLIINQDNQDFNTNKSQLTKDDNKENDQFGGLVQHILDTKKDLEGDTNEKDSLTLNKNENESKDMIHAKKDINSLRESIQFLCRNTNPLGKTMDYIQEDFDSMTKELEGWKSESIKYSDMLKTELE
ncbi:hypothetical protein PIROE2DRAFT_5929 [Piromyces sp. E2]|nr:hypothetical protein PIROE2DRAFT_5929 [Piromyces sp. E2]|eukprot:OUM66722.1 hypothetical protein PIROE2DRAFT_5929 [Piromyces sp. E2]